MRDLADECISHARAAMDMRDLYDRQKGGWLKKRGKMNWADLVQSGTYASVSAAFRNQAVSQ